ncbi:hypothetical protein PIB30_044252 [Stylosanthes scabra]|uniref:Uncharacterized protein n=1 Tax=Stylosanthes scabra TaxID=79078 RepID=A0ABU6ZEI4_9FABA|nr:hypothetical protein [Stylosanthes scabra]
MSMIYRRINQQQEESRKSFEAINARMDRMDDQLSFVCYSNQIFNETMYFPYQNTARQMKEMEMQGIPVTIANLAIHRHREEEMNQERMRHNQMVQEATAERTREANKVKAREVVLDSEEESEELASSASEEWKQRPNIQNQAELPRYTWEIHIIRGSQIEEAKLDRASTLYVEDHTSYVGAKPPNPGAVQFHSNSKIFLGINYTHQLRA